MEDFRIIGVIKLIAISMLLKKMSLENGLEPSRAVNSPKELGKTSVLETTISSLC